MLLLLSSPFLLLTVLLPTFQKYLYTRLFLLLENSNFIIYFLHGLFLVFSFFKRLADVN